MFDVAVNQHTVLKGLDIYERVGRGVGHDEYIPFRINNNQVLIDGETLPFSGTVYVEFMKVCWFVQIFNIFMSEEIVFHSEHGSCETDPSISLILAKTGNPGIGFYFFHYSFSYAVLFFKIRATMIIPKLMLF